MSRPRQQRLPSRPSTIVAFTTDFGAADGYVAAMKAAVLVHAGTTSATDRLHLIDVSHAVPPQDVLRGSVVLERAVADLPPGTIHVAVVDPGVGTDRRLLAVTCRRQTILCPDNGLITWSWRRHGGLAREIVWRPAGGAASATFHGRDILAPVAGILAAGRSPGSLTRTISSPLLLDLHPAEPGAERGTVIAFDHYGNAITNVPTEVLPAGASVRVGRRAIGPVRRTYGEVPIGRPLALVGSAGLLEIAVRNGSARASLSLKVGDEVRLR